MSRYRVGMPVKEGWNVRQAAERVHLALQIGLDSKLPGFMDDLREAMDVLVRALAELDSKHAEYSND